MKLKSKKLLCLLVFIFWVVIYQSFLCLEDFSAWFEPHLYFGVPFDSPVWLSVWLLNPMDGFFYFETKARGALFFWIGWGLIWVWLCRFYPVRARVTQSDVLNCK